MDRSDIEKMKANKDVEGLIEALKDRDENVQWRAERALVNIAEPAVEPLIEYLGAGASSVAAEALGKIGDARAVGPLTQALQAEGRTVVEKAAKALGEIGKPAVAPLIQALGDKAWLVRLGVAEALGETGDTRAVEPLTRALKDKVWFVRRAAAGSLGKIGDTRAVESLIEALEDDKDRNVRLSVIWALGGIRDTRAVEPLIKALRYKDMTVRLEAIRVLGTMGDIRAVEPLIKALGHEGLRREAVKALGEIGEPAVEPLDRAVESFIQALKDEDKEWRVRVVAAGALGEIGDTRAVEPLIQALSDLDGSVRSVAAEALGKIGDVRAVEPLTKSLKDKDKFVREDAKEALEKLKAKEG